MCTTIKSEDIILCFFKQKVRNNTLSFEILNQIRHTIEGRNQDIFVDVSFQSVRQVVVKYQDFMEIDFDEVRLTTNIEKIKEKFQALNIEKEVEQLIKDEISLTI